jgi:hypothetical protein
MRLCECGCGEPAPVSAKTYARRGVNRGDTLRFVSGHNFRQSNRGPENPGWKGDGVGYMGLHNWLHRHKKRTGVCDECGAEGKTDFANISGEYRRDLSDFRELCRPCHRTLDGQLDETLLLAAKAKAKTTTATRTR